MGIRSYKKILNSDLEALARAARKDREVFFEKYPKWKDLYANRIICVALCQGAALHYINGSNGVKDFDVWTFYAENAKAPFPYRRVGRQDYGVSKFGRNPEDPSSFKGRRIDCIGRSMRAAPRDNPILALRSYLDKKKTKSARELAKKAVVLIEPANLLGVVVWPEKFNGRG